MSDRDGTEKPRHSKGLRATLAAALAAPTAIASTGDGHAGAGPQSGKPGGSNAVAAEHSLFTKVAQRIARRDALLAQASAPSKLLAAVSLLGVSLGVSAAAVPDGASPAAGAKSAAAGEKLAQSTQLKLKSNQSKFEKSLKSNQSKFEKGRRKQTTGNR
jgi:hypothetical protein